MLAIRRALSRVVLFFSLLFSASLTAQTLEPPYEDDSYPFSTAEAVASENANGSAPNTHLAIVGFGAGTIPLDVSTPSTPALLGTAGDPRGFLQGVVRELRIHRGNGLDRVYAATGVAGVDSLDPGTGSFASDPGFPWEPTNEEIQCFAVAPFDVNGERYLFMGANDGERGGKVHVLWHNKLSGAPDPQGTIDVGEPVLSLEVSTSLVLNTVTLFVGTGRGLPGGACVAGAIHRFDFPNAPFQGFGSTITFPNAVTYSEPSGLLIKDLIIHETYQMLFAAAHGKGVLRFDIYGQGQLQTLSTTSLASCGAGVPQTWPALVAAGRKIRSLAFSPDGSQLVVGIGANLNGEQQHFGSCADQIACDGTPSGPPDYGLRILGNIADGSAGPCLLASYKPRLPNKPFMNAVSTRPENPASPFPNQLIPGPSGIAGSFYLANGRSGISRITLP